MTRNPWSRVLAGAALTVLLGSFAVVPATAEEPVAPVITVTWSTGITEGQTFPYGTVPASPTCTAADALMAVVPCAVAGYAVTVGVHTLVPMVGEPAVAATPTVTYTVTPTWKLKGFYGPVKETSTWNTRKGGSTVPLKFKIYEADGTKTHDKADIAAFTAAPIPCVGQTVATGTTTVDFLTVTTKGRTLKYRDGAFHQNWKTPKATKMTVPVAKAKGKAKTKKVVVPTCYQVTMTAVDGQSLIALFRLK